VYVGGWFHRYLFCEVVRSHRPASWRNRYVLAGGTLMATFLSVGLLHDVVKALSGGGLMPGYSLFFLLNAIGFVAWELASFVGARSERSSGKLSGSRLGYLRATVSHMAFAHYLLTSVWIARELLRIKLV
jgi:hypothetical protein